LENPDALDDDDESRWRVFGINTINNQYDTINI